MRCLMRIALLLAVPVLAASGTAHAQYVYPGGYGGWGGWGGASTVAGSAARGMGVYAAGAGAYNEQTAEARSINANTAMQVNNYMWQNQQARNRSELALMARRQARVNESAESNYSRIHDNPNAYDIHVGDAENAVLDELLNPKVLSRATASDIVIPSSLVKTLPLQYAPQAVTISLQDLTAAGAPDVLLTNPAFAAERKRFQAIVAQARKESEDGSPISAETLAKARVELKAIYEKVKATLPAGTPDRNAAENYVKALYGLTKMLQTPDIAGFLKGLDKVDTTTMGHLVAFMHSFSLRFGAAKTPQEEAAYDTLYPLLTQLRDSVVNPKEATTPFTAQAPADPKVFTNYFSNMPMSSFDPQPDPHTGKVPPPPPAPGL